MDALNQTFDSMSLFFGDTRNNLNTRGRDDMGRLRAQVERDGHGWLDGFLATVESQVVASGSRTPYHTLLKTPSRTQTAKKTRANEALNTARAEKLMTINGKLADSPLSKSNSARMPLSPLGARSLNTAHTALGASPAGSKKSRSVKVMLDVPSSPGPRPGSVPSKSSRSKGKEKKAIEKPKAIEEAYNEEVDDEDMDIEEQSHVEAADGSSTHVASAEAETPAPKKRKSASPASSPQKHRSKPQVDQRSELPKNPAARGVEDASSSTRPAAMPTTDSTGPTAERAVHAGPASTVAETATDALSTSAVITTLAPSKAAQGIKAPTVITTSPTETDLAMAAENNQPAKTAVTTATAPEVNQQYGSTEDSDLPNEDETAPTLSPAPAPAQPVRQVRSSWLSKALGGNTVPIANNTNIGVQQRGSDGGSRPSVSNPRQTLYDLASLRRSIAQPYNALKRKSDAAELDGEAEKGDAKADKASRLDKERAREREEVPASFAQPIAHRQEEPPASFANPISLSATSSSQPAGKEGSATVNKPSLDRQKSHDFFVRTTMSAQQSQPSNATNAQVDVEATSTSATRGDRGKSDIHTLSRKVEEMREQLASQAAAKQKEKERSALSISSGTSSRVKEAAIAPVDAPNAATNGDTAPAAPAVPTSGVGSGAGFLRGLGNTLGRSLGLGGLSKDAEESAKKLEAELKVSQEEERKKREAADQAEAERRKAAIPKGDKNEQDAMTTPEKAVSVSTANMDVDMEDQGQRMQAKSPEQVEEEDEAEVFAAVEPESPIRAVAAPARTSAEPNDITSAPATRSVAPATSERTQVPSSPTMHSPNRPRASPSRPAPTGIPLFSPTRARVQHVSTTPHGSPARAPAAGSGLSRFANVPRGEREKPDDGKMYPSPSRIPVVKGGLQDRIKLFEPAAAATTSNKVQTSAPIHVKSEPRDEGAMDIDGDATASEASNAEDDDDDAGEDDDEGEAETASEEEADESMEVEEVETIEQPVRPAPTTIRAKPKPAPIPSGPSKTIVIKQPTASRPPTAASMTRTDSTYSLAASTATTASRLTASASTAGPNGTLHSARLHADKTLGVKPIIAPVKSLQPNKNLAAVERRQQIDQERRRAQAERKADEERKLKEAEQRKKEYEKEQNERRKREIEVRKKAAMKDKEEREKREKAEAEQAAKAAAVQAQAEQERKRKIAAANAAQLAKSTSSQPLTASKRVVSASSVQGVPSKMKEPVRLTKPAGPLASASAAPTTGAKMGPTSFRTAPTASETANQPVRSANGTMALVGQNPSRPPTMQAVRPSALSYVPANNQAPASLTAHNVLANQRLALNVQLEAQAAAVASEDIVLPDIASEYSDSDDSDQDSPAFKRPSWAESPALKELLRKQAARDPDELFGPVQPLNMEELFKAPKNKFRHRTSSANWSRDGLTKSEEEEYARRMGFAPVGTGGANGQEAGGGQGQGTQRASVHGPSGLGR